MAKTVPQLKKIERADPERVESVVEPYPWQKAPAKPKPDTDPFAIKTVPDRARGTPRKG